MIEHFLATDSTLFLIEAVTARDITGYTNFPQEHEVILQPGIKLYIVADSMEHTGGLHIVHLREVEVEQRQHRFPDTDTFFGFSWNLGFKIIRNHLVEATTPLRQSQQTFLPSIQTKTRPSHRRFVRSGSDCLGCGVRIGIQEDSGEE